MILLFAFEAWDLPDLVKFNVGHDSDSKAGRAAERVQP